MLRTSHARTGSMPFGIIEGIPNGMAEDCIGGRLLEAVELWLAAIWACICAFIIIMAGRLAIIAAFEGHGMPLGPPAVLLSGNPVAIVAAVWPLAEAGNITSVATKSPTSANWLGHLLAA